MQKRETYSFPLNSSTRTFLLRCGVSVRVRSGVSTVSRVRVRVMVRFRVRMGECPGGSCPRLIYTERKRVRKELIVSVSINASPSHAILQAVELCVYISLFVSVDTLMLHVSKVRVQNRRVRVSSSSSS